MKDASSPVAPCAAPSTVAHYKLEPDWPHRAVPTTVRQQRRERTRHDADSPELSPSEPKTVPDAN